MKTYTYAFKGDYPKSLLYETFRRAVVRGADMIVLCKADKGFIMKVKGVFTKKQLKEIKEYAR
jgi:hypothetical protein